MAYALVALGLTLIFGVLHVINFAHGEFYLVGALGLVIFSDVLGVPYVFALLGGTLGAAALGWVVDRVAVRGPLNERGDYSTVLLSTYAVSLLIFQSVIWFWGTSPRRIDGVVGAVEIGFITITYNRAVVLMAGILLLAAIEWVVRTRAFGRELRAVAQDAFAAKVVGIDVKAIRSNTFIMSTAIAGFAGALLTPITLFSPLMGQAVLIKAFVVVVIGGMGNISGAVICGLLLGVMEALLGRLLTPGLALALIYALLLVALLVRPQGIFGAKASR